MERVQEMMIRSQVCLEMRLGCFVIWAVLCNLVLWSLPWQYLTPQGRGEGRGLFIHWFHPRVTGPKWPLRSCMGRPPTPAGTRCLSHHESGDRSGRCWQRWGWGGAESAQVMVMEYWELRW